MPKDITE
jgi:uncharacterized UBP type Zn finger protein